MELIFTILPYITFTVFVSGIVWRAYLFVQGNVTSSPLFPYASSDITEKVIIYSRQIFLFTPLFRNDKKLWLCSWLFHLSLALIVIGHIRMFLDIKISERAAFILGTFFGLIFLFTILLLLFRRLGEVKIISTIEDYTVLFLLLSLAITGLVMRLSGQQYDFSGYLTSMISLSPKSPEFDSILAAHALIAQLLIAYLPYGKLFHSIGAFVTSYLPLRWQE
jgi:nitrate reductase gamma subunit